VTVKGVKLILLPIAHYWPSFHPTIPRHVLLHSERAKSRSLAAQPLIIPSFKTLPQSPRLLLTALHQRLLLFRPLRQSVCGQFCVLSCDVICTLFFGLAVIYSFHHFRPTLSLLRSRHGEIGFFLFSTRSRLAHRLFFCVFAVAK
jgi:hypothetical protein